MVTVMGLKWDTKQVSFALQWPKGETQPTKLVWIVAQPMHQNSRKPRNELQNMTRCIVLLSTALPSTVQLGHDFDAGYRTLSIRVWHGRRQAAQGFQQATGMSFMVNASSPMTSCCSKWVPHASSMPNVSCSTPMHSAMERLGRKTWTWMSTIPIWRSMRPLACRPSHEEGPRPQPFQGG
jgi:hypothetical protein